jgi:hypothetical protein
MGHEVHPSPEGTSRRVDGRKYMRSCTVAPRPPAQLDAHENAPDGAQLDANENAPDGAQLDATVNRSRRPARLHANLKRSLAERNWMPPKVHRRAHQRYGTQS